MNLFKRTTTLKLVDQKTENWHEDFIVHLAHIIRPKVYLELGLYQCALFNRVSQIAERSIGVDLQPDVKKYVKKGEFYCQNTADFAITAEGLNLKVDMLFIDADHSKEWVKNDFNSYFSLVNDQGIILIHDSYPGSEMYTSSGYCGDGYKSIIDLTLNAKGYEMVTIPVHPGLTICRKREKHLAW
jgi:hypothetical protein